MELITKHKVKGEDIPVTISLKVAEYFEKEHKNVIRDIEKLFSNGLKNELVKMFILDTYKDKKGETRKQYLITQDGFALLVMGFTGAKAMKFKLAYIKAFNEMKKELEDFKFQRKLYFYVYKHLLKLY
jgi:Rha family phage regulatory protein